MSQPPSDQGASESKSPGRGDAVPAPAVRRLSLYLRELEAFHRRAVQTVSSKQLGQSLSLTDVQVRKDLAYFGQFGHPGIGYRVDELIARIRCILGTDRTWNAMLIGAGNLGEALLSYRGFAKKGFKIVAVFDNDPDRIGQRIGIQSPQLEILPDERLPTTVSERDIQMAILAVPGDVAQQVADRAVAAGVKGILNFAPTSIAVSEDVPVASVDLSVHLEQLAFRICERQVASESSCDGKG
jgi:redox-sensing transcriptional repressor